MEAALASLRFFGLVSFADLVLESSALHVFVHAFVGFDCHCCCLLILVGCLTVGVEWLYD